MRTLSFLITIFIFCNCSEQTEQAGGQSALLSKTSKYKIAYNVLYDAEADDYEVFVMDLDGSNKKNISNWQGVDWVYYAYKDKIYFVSDRDTTHRMYFLYEMDANNENVRKVSDIRLRDSWYSSRNNGKELIVNPHKSVDSSFYIIDLKGNVVKRIETGLMYSSDPCFSPSGDRIVFRGARKKLKKDEGFIDELYIIDDDGKNLRQLTHYPENDTTAEWYAYKAGPPRWNAKENFITYQSKQNNKYSLYAVTPDGKKQWKLTNNAQEEGWHDWSADGNWLAIELFDPGQTQFHIGLVDWQSKNLQVLTDSAFKYQQAPVFVEVN